MKATAAVAVLLVLAACKSTPPTPEEQQAAKQQAAQQEAAKQEAAREEAAKKEAKRKKAEQKKQEEEDAKYAPYPDAPAPHVADYVPSKQTVAKSDSSTKQPADQPK